MIAHAVFTVTVFQRKLVFADQWLCLVVQIEPGLAGRLAQDHVCTAYVSLTTVTLTFCLYCSHACVHGKLLHGLYSEIGEGILCSLPSGYDITGYN